MGTTQSLTILSKPDIYRYFHIYDLCCYICFVLGFFFQCLEECHLGRSAASCMGISPHRCFFLTRSSKMLETPTGCKIADLWQVEAILSGGQNYTHDSNYAKSVLELHECIADWGIWLVFGFHI